MAATSGSDAQKTEAPGQPSQASAPAPQKGPYDDLLCTICNLKACWMTPEAAGKTGSGEPAQTTG